MLKLAQVQFSAFIQCSAALSLSHFALHTPMGQNAVNEPDDKLTLAQSWANAADRETDRPYHVR